MNEFRISLASLAAAGLLLGAAAFAPAAQAQTGGNEQAPVQQQQAPDLATMSFKEKNELAKQGDVAAQISLAKDYLEGANGTRKSITRAARWLTAAAEKGDADAQFLLGGLLLEGSKDLKANPANALTLFASAADKGNIEAAYKAAHGYHYGTGVKPDLAKAVTYYTKAADGGHIAAKNNLGLMYLQGMGTERDLSVAFRLFEETANAGNAWGQNNLGGMYEMGWGTAKDAGKAIELYEKSAAQGNAHGQQNHARLKAVLASAKPADGGNSVETAQPAAAGETTSVDSASGQQTGQSGTN